MKSEELIEKAVDIAQNYRTVYALGMWGQPISGSIISRKSSQLPNWYTASKKSELAELIGTGTYGFDCVCLIKSILWGWTGDPVKNNGGAVYASKGVPDFGADSLSHFEDLTDDFGSVTPGEILWMKGHVGLYIGDGLCVECTPKWENKVQITAVSNIGTKSGYNSRKWTKHGKLPWVDYGTAHKEEFSTVLDSAVKNDIFNWQVAAVSDGFDFPKYGTDGKWGNECRKVAKKAIVKRRLLGYKYRNLTKIVQQFLGVSVDGLCGKETQKAIKAYQSANGLTADGAVGINTWEKLLKIGGDNA